MEIMELAAQLGQAIKADARVAKMEEAKAAYEKDEDIQKLMLEYNAQQIAMAEEYKRKLLTKRLSRLSKTDSTKSLKRLQQTLPLSQSTRLKRLYKH